MKRPFPKEEDNYMEYNMRAYGNATTEDMFSSEELDAYYKAYGKKHNNKKIKKDIKTLLKDVKDTKILKLTFKPDIDIMNEKIKEISNRLKPKTKIIKKKQNFIMMLTKMVMYVIVLHVIMPQIVDNYNI